MKPFDKAPIVQISTDHGTLYALDCNGEIWALELLRDPDNETWEHIVGPPVSA